MSEAFYRAVESADYEHDFLIMVKHAAYTMRRYSWKGASGKTANSQSDLMADGFTADDFVLEACSRIAEGKRKYDPNRTLIENINSVTDSLIWSAFKSGQKKPLVALPLIPDHTDYDPIQDAQDPGSEFHTVIQNEQVKAEQDQLNKLIRDLDGDDEMQLLLLCMDEGKYKPHEIAKELNCTADRASELKRKLKNIVKSQTRCQDFKEWKRKILKGA